MQYKRRAICRQASRPGWRCSWPAWRVTTSRRRPCAATATTCVTSSPGTHGPGTRSRRRPGGVRVDRLPPAHGRGRTPARHGQPSPGRPAPAVPMGARHRRAERRTSHDVRPVRTIRNRQPVGLTDIETTPCCAPPGRLPTAWPREITRWCNSCCRPGCGSARSPRCRSPTSP